MSVKSKKRYYSRTRWRQQPRDSEGRWRRVGASLGKMFHKSVRATNTVARITGGDIGFTGNLWKTTAQGTYSRTQKLPGGMAATTRIETTLHPQKKSVFEKGSRKAQTYVIGRLPEGKARGAARILTGYGPEKPTDSSFSRMGGGYFRTKTRTERIKDTKRLAKKDLSEVRAKQRKLERASAIRAQTKAQVEKKMGVPTTPAAQHGLPSGITAGRVYTARPQRRGAGLQAVGAKKKRRAISGQR